MHDPNRVELEIIAESIATYWPELRGDLVAAVEEWFRVTRGMSSYSGSIERRAARLEAFVEALVG